MGGRSGGVLDPAALRGGVGSSSARGLRQVPGAEMLARVREQAIREVLDVVQVYVDAPTFQRIKKHVLRSED